MARHEGEQQEGEAARRACGPGAVGQPEREHAVDDGEQPVVDGEEDDENGADDPPQHRAGPRVGGSEVGLDEQAEGKPVAPGSAVQG